jgi:hypothetical protein
VPLSPLLAMTLFFSGVAGLAQEVQWVGDLCSTAVLPKMHANYTVSLLIDENDAIREKVPSLKDEKGFPCSMEHSGVQGRPFWRKGVMYQIAECLSVTKDDGRRVRPWAFAKWEDGGWRLVGIFEPDDRELLEAIPCDDNRFIVVSCGRDLIDDRSPDRSPFLVASFSEGSTELKARHRIDHGQDELRPHMRGDGCFKLAYLSRKAMTDGHAVLVNSRTGLYWVFSLEKASLVRAGNIFKKVTTEMIAKGGFPDAVLWVNPEKAGTVLVEAQDEDYLIAEKGDYSKEWNEMSRNNPGMPIQEMERLMAPREKEIRENSPHIVWYRIHPENGRVEMLHEPPDGGAKLRSGWEDEVFRPMSDGSVKMGWGVGKLYEKLGIDVKNEMGSALLPPHPDEIRLGSEASEPDNVGGDAPPEDNAADGGADKGKSADKASAPAA